MSYLERWWRDSSVLKRESFINLVKNGQLEIVGGGWVMNDEVIFLGFYRSFFNFSNLSITSSSMSPHGQSLTMLRILLAREVIVKPIH